MSAKLLITTEVSVFCSFAPSTWRGSPHSEKLAVDRAADIVCGHLILQLEAVPQLLAIPEHRIIQQLEKANCLRARPALQTVASVPYF